MLLLGLSTAAQTPTAPRSSRPLFPQAAATDGPGFLDSSIEAKRLAILNTVRQKSMISDAEKLLHLAKELNDDAVAGGESLTPADRIRKAGEIEKLAKNVKEKMTYVAGSGSDPSSGYSVQIR